jgi:hypothetical protein
MGVTSSATGLPGADHQRIRVVAYHYHLELVPADHHAGDTAGGERGAHAKTVHVLCLAPTAGKIYIQFDNSGSQSYF